jgi:hypothetical protein
VDINRAWETIRENINISAKASQGYYELKKHKPWYEKGCLELLAQRKKKRLRGFGPVANYADRATAACWRSSANFCG